MANERHIGREAARWLHSAALSPVQTAAYRCDPANPERVRMNGRLRLAGSGSAARFSSPLYEAIIYVQHEQELAYFTC